MISILFSKVLWLAVGVLLLFGGLAWTIYGRYLHPSWRKESRVARACEKALGENPYELVRVRNAPPGDGPSGADLFPPPIGHSDTTRYFTYQINAPEKVEPDFSKTTRRERRLVKRYLNRELMGVVHHGKKVIQSQSPSSAS